MLANLLENKCDLGHVFTLLSTSQNAGVHLVTLGKRTASLYWETSFYRYSGQLGSTVGKQIQIVAGLERRSRQ